uniref:Uncharacterized protein n=1 Tax=Panagrellus redivivus TaxID=6233 RepID=A0A7E4ZX35_PANRE
MKFTYESRRHRNLATPKSMPFVSDSIVDKSEATLRRIASAAAYFAKCQIVAIDFNLCSVEASQYLRCQIDDIKVTTATDFLQKVPEPTFWDRFSVKKPFCRIVRPSWIVVVGPFMGEIYVTLPATARESIEDTTAFIGTLASALNVTLVAPKDAATIPSSCAKVTVAAGITVSLSLDSINVAEVLACQEGEVREPACRPQRNHRQANLRREGEEEGSLKDA